MHRSLLVPQHGRLDTHSEHCEKQRKEKVSNLFASALIFQTNGSPLGDAISKDYIRINNLEPTRFARCIDVMYILLYRVGNLGGSARLSPDYPRTNPPSIGTTPRHIVGSIGREDSTTLMQSSTVLSRRTATNSARSRLL
jgi:hypothetical protein